VLHKIFSIKTPRQFFLSAGAFLIGGKWSAVGTISVKLQIFTLFPGSYFWKFTIKPTLVWKTSGTLKTANLSMNWYFRGNQKHFRGKTFPMKTLTN